MSAPIRVLHVIGGLGVGGAEAFAINLYRAMDKEKIQFDFIKHIKTKGIFEDEITQMGGKIYSCFKYTGINHYKYCKWWNNFFMEHPEYHVVHGHVRSTAAIYLKIAKEHGLVTIAHSHSTSNGSGFASIVKNAMQLPIRNTADYLFACSDKAGLWLYGRKAIKQSNYRVIPNGIDLDRFAFNKAKREEMRKRLGINEHEFVIGHIGRFSEPKNHKYLIDIFAEYYRNNPNSRLLMIGNGEKFESVKIRCEKLGIIGCVIMPGNCANTEDFYQAMDVFVFPSLWEGLPVAVVEAQASGLPCLISDVITREVNLTDLVSYLPLVNKQIWLENIDKAKFKMRNEVSDKNKLRLQLFDAKRVAAQLQTFYLEQDKKGKV